MSLLTNLGSPTLRRVVYYTASALSAAWTAYEASGGDWHAAVPPFLGTIILATAGANASETPED